MSDMTSVFTQQQQAPPTAPFGMSNGVAPGFNMPLNMMPFGPQMLAMFAQQQQQTATSSIGTQPSTIMPQIQENFTTALMDIMKMYGTMPGGTPMGGWPMFPNMNLETQQQMPPSAGGSSGSGTDVRENSSTKSFGRKITALPSLSPPVPERLSPAVLSPSIKRKRKSGAVDNSSKEDSSGSDDDNEPPLATLSKINKRPEEKQLARRNGTDLRKAKRTGFQYTAPQQNFPSQSSKPISSSDPSKKLLVHSNGQPMQFFVQVDQNNRQEITRAIKVRSQFMHLLTRN
jgi:hypothetical protein